jgi:hypothetical protein
MWYGEVEGSDHRSASLRSTQLSTPEDLSCVHFTYPCVCNYVVHPAQLVLSNQMYLMKLHQKKRNRFTSATTPAASLFSIVRIKTAQKVPPALPSSVGEYISPSYAQYGHCHPDFPLRGLQMILEVCSAGSPGSPQRSLCSECRVISNAEVMMKLADNLTSAFPRC